jgi:hypothetical protein
MIAVARPWQEPDRPDAGAGDRGPGAGRGLGRSAVGSEDAREGTVRASLRPVGPPERALQLPLIPEDDLPAGATGPDRPPELTHYRDEGCRFWHACLSCPFPRCLYEEPRGPARALNAYRDGEVRRMFAAGRSATEIAEHFGLTRRSVYRILGPVGRGAGRGEQGAGCRDNGPRSRSHVPGREQVRHPAPRTPLPAACD